MKKEKKYSELKQSLTRKTESIKRLEASTDSFDEKKELIEAFYKKSTYKEKIRAKEELP